MAMGPEVAPATGSVPALLPLSAPSCPRLGHAWRSISSCRPPVQGIVVPASAIVDDGGVPVVYVQLEGEAFERREVVVRVRQAGQVALDGIREGERVVVVGGDAIRRAALLSSGPVEGHVH